MTATDNPRVQAAIWYARQRFGVFPVWSPNDDGSCRCPAGRACGQPGKHPIPPTGFKAATLDETKIRSFLAAASEPNIGITPPPSHFGWDVDGDVPQTIAELAERLGPLPPTLTTITGHGTHLIFSWPADLERPKGHPFGIVTRWADTGYLIGAGSRHASGAMYRLELGEDGQPRPIAELPIAWAEALLAYREPPTAPGQPGTKIGQGARHDFLRDAARLFRGKGLTGDALFDAVGALNIERCSPPKTPDEVRRAIGEVETKFGADSVGHGPETWEPPLSLDRRADLPAFPVDALPALIAAFVMAESVATQTPPDMAAMFGLTALATVAGGRVTVEPRPGWVEGVNLFGVVAMEPGSRKSAVHRDMTAPLLDQERNLAAAARPELADAASRRRVAEATLARLEKAVAGAGPETREGMEQERSDAAVALDALAVPVEPRLFTADATPEALASLLHAHGGRMAVLSAEGGIFELMAGRYSNGVPNLDVFLCGHAGDLLRVDRKGRPTEYVERPALTIGVAVQPAVLRKAARVPEMSGRGLLDRFLYALPPPNVGFRDTDPPPVPDAIREAYAATVRTLAASLDGHDVPFTLRFTTDATAVLAAWSAELEPRRRPDADLGHIQGWAAKLDGATVRIAGLLHLVRHVADGWGRPIEADTMEAAVTIGRYLVAHALAVFDYMGADPRLEAARRIGRWIVATHQATFTKREAFRALRGQSLFPTIERLTVGLAALDEHGWVRQLAPERGPGRPPARYETNPAIFLEAWTKWPEPTTSADPDDVLSILSIDSEGRETAAPEPDSATREPELWVSETVAPTEPAETLDWLAVPLPEPDRPGSDEWWIIG